MVGGSSGSAMAAALKAAKTLGAGQRCVVVLPDSTRNYMSKFLDDEWMVAQGLEPPSLLTRGAGGAARTILDGGSDGPAAAEWWEVCTVEDLDLPEPYTVPPTMASSEAIKIMNERGFDQLPVVVNSRVLGVVTLGNLTSKILAKAAKKSTPVSSLMFTQFRQVRTH